MNNFIYIKPEVTPWHSTADAILHIPKTGALPNGKFPLIIFFHGTQTNLGNIISQPLPSVVEANGSVGTSDGKLNFAVVCPIESSYSPTASWIPSLVAWLEKAYPNTFEPSIRSATGESAGGHESFSTACDKDAGPLFNSCVPMSMAAVETNLSILLANKTKVWFFTGDIDGDFTSNTKNAYANVKAQAPAGTARLTVFPGAHGGWAQFYARTWNEGGMNIYDFMLAAATGAISPAPVPTAKDVELDITLNGLRRILYTDGTFERK